MAGEGTTPPRPSALWLLDLDRFKEVNDSLGHGIGDELLISVAQRVRSVINKEDLVARLGGDESRSSSRTRAEGVRDAAGRLGEQFEIPFEPSSVTLDIACSIGIAWRPARLRQRAPAPRRRHGAVSCEGRPLGLRDLRPRAQSGAPEPQAIARRPAPCARGRRTMYYQPKADARRADRRRRALFVFHPPARCAEPDGVPAAARPKRSDPARHRRHRRRHALADRDVARPRLGSPRPR